MIKPKHFGFNPDTAESNVFQQDVGDFSQEDIERSALAEFQQMVDALTSHGIKVDVIDDTDSPVKSDAVFPNNWISTHSNGNIVTYPMFSASRRSERREDIIDFLSSNYQFKKRYAFEQFEAKSMFLEGTGSLVLDRAHKIAYACLSERTDIRMVDKFAVLTGYNPVIFEAFFDDKPIYHTNVVMSVGVNYVVICLECIPKEEHRLALLETFNATGKTVIEITSAQLGAFAGNMLQLETTEGKRVCVMSQTAFNALSAFQRNRLEFHNDILLPVDISTIEKYGGGSARCMIAENFLLEKH